MSQNQTSRSDNLPPPNFKEDIEKYEAFSESKEVSFQKCSHKNIKFNKGELRCPCGVGFTGPRLQELYTLLTK